VTVSTNITSATLAGQIVDARDVFVLAGQDPTSGNGTTPTYNSDSLANAGVVDATVVAPAIALTAGFNATVAALTLGSIVGTSTNPVRTVVVFAKPSATTTSTATGRTTTSLVATAGGPVAVTLIFDTTDATSEGTVDATATGGSVTVKGVSADTSSANSTAGSAGVTNGATTADSLLQGARTQLSTLIRGLSDVPTLVRCPPACRPGRCPRSSGASVRGHACGGLLPSAAANAVNIHIDTTTSSVLNGGITVLGNLDVISQAHTTASANADSSALSGPSASQRRSRSTSTCSF